jgi:crossover junction endodeoxyribonuclease RuvC
MALLAAAQAGLPLSLYKPAEVKQWVTSYGRGSKEQVAEMVRVLLGLDSPPQPADAADALAVALCHCLRRESAIGSRA